MIRKIVVMAAGQLLVIIKNVEYAKGGSQWQEEKANQLPLTQW